MKKPAQKSRKVLLSFKTDPDTKRRAQEIAAILGVSLSAIINAYLRRVARTGEVHLSLSANHERRQFAREILSEAERAGQRLAQRTKLTSDKAVYRALGE